MTSRRRIGQRRQRDNTEDVEVFEQLHATQPWVSVGWAAVAEWIHMSQMPLSSEETPEDRNMRIATSAIVRMRHLFTFLTDSVHHSYGTPATPVVSRTALRNGASTRRCPLEIRGESCCICCEDFNGRCNVMTLHCGHHYHPKCIERWAREHSDCPLCKQNLLPPCASSSEGESEDE
jgi:hypothetical protein